MRRASDSSDLETDFAATRSIDTERLWLRSSLSMLLKDERMWS
jgi:hypothetical protein